jgi:copper chaperone
MDEHENCHVEPVEKPVDEAALETAMAAYLTVGGMGCPRCAMRVRNGLLALPGVLLAEVFLDKGLAAAAYDPAQVSPEDLVRAVDGAGNDGRHHYWAEVMRVVSAADALQQPQ